MEKITNRVKDLALSYGADVVGIVSTGMLRGGPLSTDLSYVLVNAVGPFLKRPRSSLSIFNVLMPGDRVELTCGNCQLICHPDRNVRKRRYKMLVESGVIVEKPDGSREAVSPEEAKKRLAAMDPATRALYEET